MANETPSKPIIKKTKQMPQAKPKTKKAVKVIKKMRVATESKVISTPKTVTKSFNMISLVKVLLIIAIGVVVFLLIQKNRSLFVAGTVNKTIVTRMELNSKMAEKYAEQTFEEIVSEKLLEENLAKNKIEITEKEVQDELANIKAQYGGEEQFKAALTQFGMTEEKAVESIKQSLGLKKLIETQGNIEISDEAVAAYFKENAETYTGKKLEEVSTEIKDLLFQQEIYTKSQAWYQQIRKDAKVNSYLK